jgi:hypothetical protein
MNFACGVRLLSRWRTVGVIGGPRRRGDRSSPWLHFQGRIEPAITRARQLDLAAPKPSIRGEAGAEHRAGDRQRGEQSESDEHDEHADAHDAERHRGRSEAILDCK